MLEALADGALGVGPMLVLVAALLAALAFEFVNGFHDTANAVATVIYTRALRAGPAVVLSGVCNFLGLMLSAVWGISVAISITRLLPVDLVVASGTGRGLAMVAALLVSAIAWNIATWYRGLPASSSHTLIGAILGVGLASSLLDGHFGEGVSWSKAGEVFMSLLLSPVLGFVAAGAMLVALRVVLRSDERIFRAPGATPPPSWIRGLLVGTCAAVSFAHGSNDGQKGVGLVMLILVGIVPAGFALDLGASADELRVAEHAAAALETIARDEGLGEDCGRHAVDAAPICAVAEHAATIREVLAGRATVRDVPPDERWRVREGTVRIDAALRALEGDLPESALTAMRAERTRIARLTEYAPGWVLFLVALALGVGTTVGWRRIVVTVGEKIGKTHLTYAQGASAELVAASTIALAGTFGLPVSTTHVLSSGVAGTMVVERCGLRADTVRNIALAWLLTLPVTMALSGVLFVLFSLFV